MLPGASALLHKHYFKFAFYEASKQNGSSFQSLVEKNVFP